MSMSRDEFMGVINAALGKLEDPSIITAELQQVKEVYDEVLTSNETLATEVAESTEKISELKQENYELFTKIPMTEEEVKTADEAKMDDEITELEYVTFNDLFD